MSTPTTSTPEVTPEETAPQSRTKMLVKKTFTRVAVPVLVGAAAVVLISRRNNSDDSNTDK